MSELRQEIAELLAAGLPQTQIAHRLGVAGSTVGYHVRKLREAPPPRSEPPPPAHTQIPTRERVAELLAQGMSKLEIARKLEIGKSTVSYHARRLGIPVDERGARRYDWAQVQRYYDEGHSVRECAEAFGFSHQTWHAAKLRGDLVTRPALIPLEELCVENSVRNRRHLRQRLVAAGITEDRCERCRLDSWFGEPIPLELHHINGDRYDNRIENLQILCANCHGLTENWSGRNRSAAENGPEVSLAPLRLAEADVDERGVAAEAVADGRPGERAAQPEKGAPERMSARASSRSSERPTVRAPRTRRSRSR